MYIAYLICTNQVFIISSLMKKSSSSNFGFVETSEIVLCFVVTYIIPEIFPELSKLFLSYIRQ